MARINKQSRIKGLPPKIILQTMESKQNVYPGKVRHDSQGKIIPNFVKFDDNSSMPFSGSPNLNFGTNVPQEIIDSKYYNLLGQDMSSSLYGSGTIKKNVDQFIYIDTTQSFEPFIENSHVEIERLNDPFFVTGSDREIFGNSLSQPLSSKTKIVIDLTPAVSNSFYMENYASSSRNHPMAYWNKDLKTWEGIGIGKEFATYNVNSTSSINLATLTAKHQEFFNDQCIGFAQGFYDGTLTDTYSREVGQYRSFGNPITTFGFPLHPKFHATSSNEFPMSMYIDRPFLLEKIVLEISATFLVNNVSKATVSGQIGHPAYIESICNFFILNQKTEKIIEKSEISTLVASGSRSFTTHITTSLTPANLFSPVTFSGSFITKTRDLITWGQVFCEMQSSTELSGSTFLEAQYIHDQLRENREIIIDSTEGGKYPFELVEGPSGIFNSVHSCDWNKNIVLKMKCKSPLKTPKILPSVLILMDGNFGSSDAGVCAYSVGNDVPGRKASYTINPRDYLNTVADTKVDAISTQNIASVVGNFANGYNKLFKENPYLLMPSDSLIFGWQLPIGKFFNDQCRFGESVGPNVPFIQGKGPELIFAPSPAKITLYGSYLSEGKETHDTLKQSLTSNVIHEVIGDN